MNLSLEVKKFMNNEHTGEYVTVVLPSELPIERSEVREVNRDRTAANSRFPSYKLRNIRIFLLRHYA